MRTYKRLTVEGYPLYVKQSFDLSQPGLSVILGLNLNGNAGGASALRNTNAVGKSLFFSAIQEIAFKAGPSGNAKDKIKHGKITLELAVGKTEYVLVRYIKGKSEKFSITQDGEVITPKGPADVRALIEKILGRDEETFSVVDYLESGTHHIRMGDTGVRRAFFTKFFDFTTPDRFKLLVKGELDRLKTDAAVLKELQATAASQTTGASVKELRASLAEAQSKLDTIKLKLEELRGQRDYHNFLERYTDALTLCVVKGKKVSPADRVASLASQAEKLTVFIKAAKNQAVYLQEKAAYAAAVKARAAYFAEAGKKDIGKTLLVTALTAAKETRDKAATKMQDARDHAAVLKADAARHRSEITSLEHALEALSKDTTCSQCGQPITREHTKLERKRLKDKLGSQVQLLDDLAKEQALALAAVNLAQRNWQEDEATVEAKQTKLDWYNEAPRVPDKPEAPSLALAEDFDAEAYQEKRARIRSQLDQLLTLEVFYSEDALPKVKRLLDFYLSDVEDTFSDAAYDKLTQRSVKHAQDVASLEQQLVAAIQARDERKRLQARVAQLEEDLKDLDAVRVLEQAFSATAGVKQLQINVACRILEAQVNKYAKFFFPEPYTFEFDLDTQFQILATRNVGATSESSDVRRLSGAESLMFDITLAVALTSMLPPSKRSNLMVLDEMDAKLGPSLTDAFVRILPVLNKVIPHIVVITPKTDTQYGDTARYYTVVKRGPRSKIFAGRHLSAATLPKPKAKSAT